MTHTIQYNGNAVYITDTQKELAMDNGLDLEHELMSALKHESTVPSAYNIRSSSGKSTATIMSDDLQRYKDEFGIDCTILLKRLLDDNEQYANEFGNFSYEISCGYNGTFKIWLCT